MILCCNFRYQWKKRHYFDVSRLFSKHTGIVVTVARNYALIEKSLDRFDFVNFDACLMSSVEVAATLSECADYLILSAETGLSAKFRLKRLKGTEIRSH